MTSARVVRAASRHQAHTTKKTLWIVRHGQAAHNPRAEAAKDSGCSHDEFLELMRQDDALDADLTELGKRQAQNLVLGEHLTDFDLVVSSPLSRALRTADLVAAPHAVKGAKRMAVEHFREVNGWLLNAKRRNKHDLQNRFESWDFSELPTMEDELWSESLETQADCAERGYTGLRWLLEQPAQVILLVCHGGILRFTMNLHDHVTVVDERSETSGNRRDVKSRFGNCEFRKYILSWQEDDSNSPSGSPRSIRLAEV